MQDTTQPTNPPRKGPYTMVDHLVVCTHSAYFWPIAHLIFYFMYLSFQMQMHVSDMVAPPSLMHILK